MRYRQLRQPLDESEVATGQVGKEAKETGAGWLVITCPFREQNLSDANRANNAGMEVLELVRLVADAVA